MYGTYVVCITCGTICRAEPEGSGAFLRCAGAVPKHGLRCARLFVTASSTLPPHSTTPFLPLLLRRRLPSHPPLLPLRDATNARTPSTGPHRSGISPQPAPANASLAPGLEVRHCGTAHPAVLATIVYGTSSYSRTRLELASAPQPYVLSGTDLLMRPA